MPRSALALGLLALVGSLTLAGCASTGADAAASDRIAVGASTDVYAQIAEEIGGDLVDVTAIVSSAAQDPHSFEPSVRDQLTVDRAALIIENGGGYDAFVDALIDASGSTAPVITAAELSPAWSGESADHATDDHDHGHMEGFNEHVWYDPSTMGAVAEEIAAELSELSPADAEAIDTNLATFLEGITGLQDSLADLKAAHAGDEVFVTEPVPLYLVDAAGLVNVTPDAFSEAVEEGQDVAPSTLLESLKLLRSGDVRVVIVNSQTGGAETAEVVSEADTQQIPVVEFSETLPGEQTYLSWMQANIAALAGALDQ
ncbi:zinc/manganese transport system substrate-binding protein [Microbacterium sp. cf046]|uniref:metal ABC transporter solute-binding protein, Zn/Mn family n=1 Tax=Microbacterium sp. cf046 TaxID=1761803 RepID=UPI0008F1B5EB|nr:zinc ABC transporter substrate-binding protein [Microbacterium sp. cf046]SFR87483.1 zinc/manganese transport system substrate-binding protein [Microbacterium sp. cf046]